MDIFSNLDLFSVGIAISSTLILAFLVLFSGFRSATNRSFFLFSVTTALWGIVNYISYQFESNIVTLWLSRSVLFLAIYQAYFLFLFLKEFPKAKSTISRFTKIFSLIVVIVVSVLTLTPFVFSGLNTENDLVTPEAGPMIALFGITSIAFVLVGLYSLILKIKKNKKDISLYLILIGLFTMFLLIIPLNFILPTFFKNINYLQFGALFTTPFIIFTSYAILKHHLFNTKAVAIGVLTFSISSVSVTGILFANSIGGIIFKSIELILILIFGILLIKSVVKEVKQREEIEKLATNLEKANKGQSDLLHFITHQVKGYFTKSKLIFYSFKEGDYGKFTEEASAMINEGFRSATEGVDLVQNILHASNLEKGTLQSSVEKVDLKAVLDDVVKNKRPQVEEKGLEFKTNIEDSEFIIETDPVQVREVFRNLIDNSIRYTPKGSIIVSLTHNDGMIVFYVKDTGVGILKEDIGKLFKKGGKGTDSSKFNVDSTGYGLYIVKGIVEQILGGRVWAESEGRDKGSTFYVQIPQK